MNSLMPVHQRVRQALVHRLLAPGQIARRRPCFLPPPLTCSAISSKTLGRVGAAIEQHVLDALAQFRLDIIVERQRAGVDDAHVHAGADGVIEKHRVHRLAHGFVAAERERDVGDAAGDVRVRQAFDGCRRVASKKALA